MTTYLLKPGELSLKGGNREGFEHILRRNIKAMLGRSTRIELTRGRFFVRCPEDSETKTEECLRRLFGIAGWAKVRACPKTTGDIFRLCIEEAGRFFDRGLRTFKVNARRTDKSFPLNSAQICSNAGEAILRALPGFKVDVHEPELVVTVEIREKAYVYGNGEKGLQGLPVGTAGKGLCLLSGGIDSPVALYMMCSRGMHMEAVYFHAWPYTSDEARQKVVRLAEITGSYGLGVRLHIIPVTTIQMRIKERAPAEWTTVLLRMAMMEAAENLAVMRRAKCLITGESLSQVASQTIENINCTQSRLKMPVLRPLIGMDKEDIIRLAKKIGTYETSILPYQDCCVLFSPPHPILRGDPRHAQRLYEELELQPLIEDALKEMTVEKCAFPDDQDSLL
ncbi:MAG: tRNA 4-thiouridine(8) synthase ThiI [Treponema sp.]|nr:tRNA 4-thiouridine(8) synthase ThiI [Treponema sp.]